MSIKSLVFVAVFSIFFACSSDNDAIVPRNLGDFISAIGTPNLGGVVACAANAEGENELTYIFYYPEDGATDVRYYEAASNTLDSLDFTKYRRQALETESIFGGKLQRFVRSNDASERWCLVTYFLDGELQVSNPILIKSSSQPTQWKDSLNINFPTKLNPVFKWSDFNTPNNDVYFQVLFETEADQFISGTYTQEQRFTFYDTRNVTFNINTNPPDDLKTDTEYLMTVMGVSQTHNWVNLIIEETFVPQNLQEYLDAGTVNTSQKITAFGLSENNSSSNSFIYFYPIENARDFRYYETESLDDDKSDLQNYRRKFLDNSTDFGAQLRRFSRNNTKEVWSIVTYEVDGEVYTSDPIKIEIENNATQYETEITTTQTQSLLPVFTWSSFNTSNSKYLTVLSEKNSFIAGFFVEEERYQYKNDSGAVGNINSVALPDLVLDNEYNISIFGLNENNWVNLAIQNSFEAK